MFDFPSSPTPGQSVVGASGETYVWDGTKWAALVLGLVNVGGLLGVADASWPTSAGALPAGSLWSNGGIVTVVGTTTPSGGAPPVYFGLITSAALLALGGANLPLTAGATGSLQLWNNSHLVEIS